VLTGAPITDMKLTLLVGKAHLKHTEGGDFRQATYRAIRQGLMQAKSVLLEPWYSFAITAPTPAIGRAITDIRSMGGEVEAPENQGDISILKGLVPAAKLGDYNQILASYTQGRGQLQISLHGYLPCHNTEAVVAAANYDPEADLDNTPDSVFCAHGAGFTVKWDQVKAHMHLDSGLKEEKQPQIITRNLRYDDMELEKIIQETVSGNWEDPAEPAPEAEAPVEETPFEEFPIGEFPVDEFPVDSEDPAFPPDLPDEEEETVEEGPVRKVRPKRKTGYGLFAIPHLLSTAIWAAIAIFIGISFGRLLWVCAADVLAFGREDKTVTVTITASDNLESVAEKFHNAGLIKYKQLFMLYGQITNMEEDGEIVPGTYELNTLFDYHALAIGIAGESAIRIEVEVMIPEGYTCAQIFELLEEKEICKAEELERYAETSQFASYWFL
jgi:hypothetical protein